MKSPHRIEETLHRLSVDTMALCAGRLVAILLGIAQISVLVRRLGVEGLGQFSFALAFCQLFTVFSTLGLQRFLVRELSRSQYRPSSYLYTALLQLSVTGIATTTLVVIVGLFVESGNVVRLAILFAAISVTLLPALQTPFEAILISRKRFAIIGWLWVTGPLLKVVILLAVLTESSTSAVAHGAIAAVNLLVLILTIFCTLPFIKFGRPEIRLDLLAAQLRTALPITLAMLGSLLYFKSDLALLRILEGASGYAAAGIYGLSFRIIEPLCMVSVLWGTVVFPALCRLSEHSNEDLDRLRSASLRLALLIAFPLAFGLAVTAEPALRILAGDRFVEFEDSVPVLRMLAIIVPLFFFNGVSQEFYYEGHRVWYVAVAYGVAALVSIAGNLIAIPIAGPLGASIIAIAAHGTVSLLFLAGARTLYSNMRLPRLVVKTALSSCAMSFVIVIGMEVNIAFALVLGTFAYLIMQLLLNTLNQDERAVIGLSV